VNAGRAAGAGGRPGGCVALIGMPGAGKSTVGVLVAKHLGLAFVDTDLLVQQRAGRRLQQILDAEGYRALRHLEEEAILGLGTCAAVVATGGSAVYSERAMRRLGELGVIVLLKAALDVLTARIDDYDRRGIANPADQSLEEIFRERAPLYERHADVVVDVDGLSQEEAARAVIAAVRGRETRRGDD
jgi:shikimate kinase